ncbi:MobC family plasmid mobilization relaxosome protein [Candidatus Igneacidithiobacillus taiwanensis]|uniref:MobC family plasmid mobilization relaxosome protein n=1 Tax=Candidatus Igneacidithiobacillus taiwanensis TaxID=1945924 RepID=UPI00289B8D48|nr:MobC family plasmid mobilization relaxosome protein [Candidatus Igneacidithiobacillus taiwanensis]
MAQEALDKRIAFRLPEKVAESWKSAAKASRLSLSDWVRMQVGTDKVPAVKTGKPTPAKMPKRRPAPEADPQLIREVAALGNNLNQIARHLNSGGTYTQASVLIPLLHIEQHLQEILDRCTSNS